MRKRSRKLSQAVIGRLPKYYRYLDGLYINGVTRISSGKLAEFMEITASQVRQDLSSLGEFGQHGYGYTVSQLLCVIKETLGISNTQNVIIIGAGNMGHALASYGKLSKHRFKIVGIFDKDLSVIGTNINDLIVQNINTIDKFIKSTKVDIGAICVPSNDGAIVGEKLVSLGIKALWNFSPVDLKFSDDVVVENVHLTDSLMILSYRYRQKSIINDAAEKILGAKRSV